MASIVDHASTRRNEAIEWRLALTACFLSDRKSTLGKLYCSGEYFGESMCYCWFDQDGPTLFPLTMQKILPVPCSGPHLAWLVHSASRGGCDRRAGGGTRSRRIFPSYRFPHRSRCRLKDWPYIRTVYYAPRSRIAVMCVEPRRVFASIGAPRIVGHSTASEAARIAIGLVNMQQARRRLRAPATPYDASGFSPPSLVPHSTALASSEPVVSIVKSTQWLTPILCIMIAPWCVPIRCVPHHKPRIPLYCSCHHL